ncbi:MAG: DUF4177 domain-containing protein [Candidatus Nealsonbacteria bacterium]
MVYGEQFEYKVLKDLELTCDDVEKTLNDLGFQGWELVGFSPSYIQGEHVFNYSYVFKRKKC